ncbi:hypothetical protein DL770_009595 [Monosporascus sp. CRB-9-2]|nr:hypothetical protein DL770_009595 [Monosporascus sp. CRB-9-2]
MDPISVTSLVASSIGVADIVTRLGFGLQHLQQQFSGALDHVDNIAQQTRSIDFAIREICSFLHKSPNTFPTSFESRLRESMTKIDKVVGQIQDHAQSVKTEASKSPSKGKILHLRHADKVVQWENNLGVQIQALSLLLQVAQLRSNDERTSVLEQDSSKKLFEKASSMLARIGNSSGTPSAGRPSLTDIKSFSFDPGLLQTKVYRRACESLWRREITLNGEDICQNASESASSTPSNGAIASQSGGSNPGTSDDSGGTYDKTPSSAEPEKNIGPEAWKTIVSECREHQRVSAYPPQLVSGESVSDTTQVTAGSSDTYATDSTLAATIPSIAQSKEVSERTSRSNASLGNSVILVVVEKVGSDHDELPIRQVSHHYNVVRDSISKVRDCVLLASGIDPATYRGSMVSCTIETCGHAVHKFPFTAAFLGAALEKMEEGFYSSIEVLARFSARTSLKDDYTRAQTTASRCEEADLTVLDKPLATTTKPLPSPNGVPHFILGRNDALPVSQQILTAKGGFSEVYKVKFDAEFLFWSHTGSDARKSFACKKLLHDDKKAFQREVDVLTRLCSQPKNPHIIKLLATFEHKQHHSNKYYLIFPWASGNLREFWKGRDRPEEHLQTSSSRQSYEELVLWVTQQCAGIADGLRTLHGVLNKAPDKTPQTSGRKFERPYGRHGDIKPENILWFGDYDKAFTHGTLVISDFGLSHFRTSAKNSRAKEAGRISCTPTYRAPECDLSPSNRRLTRAYDIWSLGCVYLEFVTWLLDGWNGVEAFRRERRIHVKDDAFFIIDDGRFNINPSVTQHLEELQVKASSFESPLHEVLILFLNCVSSCLEVKDDKRPPAETLAEQFQDLYMRLNKAIASKRGSQAFSPAEPLPTRAVPMQKQAKAAALPSFDKNALLEETEKSVQVPHTQYAKSSNRYLWDKALRHLQQSEEDPDVVAILEEFTTNPAGGNVTAEGSADTVKGLAMDIKEELEYEIKSQPRDGNTGLCRKDHLNTEQVCFVLVGDVAGRFDRFHAALPWAAVRLVLVALTSSSELRSQLLGGIGKVTSLVLQCDTYQQLYMSPAPTLRLPEDVMDALETSIVQSCSRSLLFLGFAIQRQRSWSRAVDAPFKLSDVDKCAKSLVESGGQLAQAADNCEKHCNYLNHGALKGLRDFAVESHQGILDQTTLTLNINREIFLARLRTAERAAYDHLDNQFNECHPHTRVALLDKIYNWAHNHDDHGIIWLQGIAGSGKSTICDTIIRKLAEERTSGVGFFFKRDEVDRGNATRFYTTIAPQLVSRLLPLAQHVRNAIEADSNIRKIFLNVQFQKLILQSLKELNGDPQNCPRTVVIVVDALDECVPKWHAKAIILQAKQSSSVRLKFFVTSRREFRIRHVFDKISGINQDLVLHQVDEDIIELDIFTFMESELLKCRGDYNESDPKGRHLPLGRVCTTHPPTLKFPPAGTRGWVKIFMGG